MNHMFVKNYIENGGCYFRFAYRLTANVEESRDLVQESARRILATWKKFNKDRDIKAYNIRIIRNIYFDRLRKKSRLNMSIDYPMKFKEGECHLSDFITSNPDERPEIMAERHDICNRVRDAIKNLPKHMRLIAQMILLDGINYDETAKILGIPRGTIGSRIKRSKRLLRSSMGDIFK